MRERILPLESGRLRLRRLDGQATLGDVGQWVKMAIALRDSDDVLGEMDVHLSDSGDVAQVRVSGAREDVAKEALDAIVDLFFTKTVVKRVEATVGGQRVVRTQDERR